MNRQVSVSASAEAYTKAILHCLKYPTQPIFGLLVGKFAAPHSDPTPAAASSGPSNREGDDGEATRPTEGEAGAEAVTILDVVPLFHSCVYSAPHPLVDVAVNLTQTTAAKDGCQIVGLYVANERLHDRTLSTVLTPLIHQIQAEVTASSAAHPTVVWFVDNAALTIPPKVPCVTPLVLQKGVAFPYFHRETPVPSAAMGGHVMRFVNPARESAAAPEAGPTEKVAEDRLEAEAEPSSGKPVVPIKRATRLHTVNLLAVTDLLTVAVASAAHHRVMDFEDHLEDPEVDFTEQPLNQLIVPSGGTTEAAGKK